MIVLIFLVLVMLNIIALYIIINKFFCKEKTCGQKSSWSIVAKIFSVILNLALAFSVFWAVVFGLWFISVNGLFYKSDKIYISDFYTGLILIEASIFLPYGLNLLFYKLWYRKTGLTKWWIFPSIVIGVCAFVLCIFNIISNDFIKDWSRVRWINR